MSTWLEQIDQNIRRRKLFQDGQSILVAVSGGVDSMALLHALHRLAKRHAWRLAACHFDHQIRQESRGDAQLVRQTVKKLDIPFTLGKGDVPSLAREAGISLEMAGREMRHDFFVKTARKLRMHTVALAHHAGDQVELFFLRLFRGAGGEGISGMKWISHSPGDPEIFLVRPFLGETKSDLASFAQAEGIVFAEDATNAHLDMPRNRIRHELIPLLEKHYQPALGRTLSRVMDITGAEAAFAAETAAQWLASASKSPFDQLPVAVQRRCVQAQLLELVPAIDFEHLEVLRTQPGTPITLKAGLCVQRDAAGLLQVVPPVNTAFSSSLQNIQLSTEGSATFDGVALQWQITHVEGRQFERSSDMEYFDAARVGGRIVLRHWRPGDRFQPIGAKAAVKLQDLFVNAKAPVAGRRQRVIAEAESGEIFWVEGLRIAEFARLTESTRQRLQWMWRR